MKVLPCQLDGGRKTGTQENEALSPPGLIHMPSINRTHMTHQQYRLHSRRKTSHHFYSVRAIESFLLDREFTVLESCILQCRVPPTANFGKRDQDCQGLLKGNCLKPARRSIHVSVSSHTGGHR